MSETEPFMYSCPRCSDLIYFGPKCDFRITKVRCNCSWKYAKNIYESKLLNRGRKNGN